MRTLFSLLLFIFVSFQGKAQNIYTTLHINDAYKIGKKKPIKKIESNTVFYNVNNTEKRKEITYLNAHFRVTQEERYNEDDELIFKMVNEYEADTLKVKSTTTRKIPLFGNEITSTHYIYDDHHFLIRYEKYNAKNQLIEVVSIENDERGNPVFQVINNGELGYEKATYDYANNTYAAYIYNPKDELVSSSLYNTFNYEKPTKDNVFNEYGDLVSSLMFSFEYKYDPYGNWTKEIRYKKVGDKKIRNAEFTRKIYYE